MKKYFQNKTFLAGFVIVSMIVVFMVIGLILLPYDPAATDAFNKFQKASAEHLLGTDHLGRDVFSRLIVGTRNSLLVGLCVMLASARSLFGLNLNILLIIGFIIIINYVGNNIRSIVVFKNCFIAICFILNSIKRWIIKENKMLCCGFNS